MKLGKIINSYWNNSAILVLIDPELVDENPLARRILTIDDSISELEHSMDRVGLLTPIKVRPSPQVPGRYQLIFGHRRLTAARTLGWTRIDAEIEETSEERMLFMALAENIVRTDFSDYEKGFLFEKLHTTFGKTYEEIGTLIGKSKSYVAQHIAMLKLFDERRVAEDAELRRALAGLTEGHARILARVTDGNDRIGLAKFAFREKLCMKELDKVTRMFETGSQLSGWTKLESRRQTASHERQLHYAVQQMIDGLQERDPRPFISSRFKEHFSIFDDFPPFVLLRGEDADQHEEDLVRTYDIASVMARDQRIDIVNDTAIATMYVDYEIRIKDQRAKLVSRASLVFVKRKQGWLLVHEHWSPMPSSVSKIPNARKVFSHSAQLA